MFSCFIHFIYLFIFAVDETASDDLAKEEYNELVAALNVSLVKNVAAAEDEMQLDEFPSVFDRLSLFIHLKLKLIR